MIYAAPGDQQSPTWMLTFEDPDRVYSLFHDEAEARQAFAAAEDMGWNCHLWELAKR